MIAISIPLPTTPEIKESCAVFNLLNDLLSKIPHHHHNSALRVVDFILGRQEIDSYVSWPVNTGNSDADESRQAGSVQ